MRQIGDQIYAAKTIGYEATAAGTGDNTKVTSAYIDRLSSNGGMFNSLQIVCPYLATLTAAQTLSLTVSLLHGTTTSPATSVAVLAKTVVETGADTATSGIYECTPVDLRPYGRYLKIELTPDLSHSGTDTASGHAVALLGNCGVEPAGA